MIKSWMFKPGAAVALVIGAGASGGGDGSFGAGYTTLDKTNPANIDGIITSFDIFADVNLTGCKMGVFSGSGTSWTIRNYATIGAVTAGSKQTFTGLSVSVVAGDIIGIYFSAGTLNRNPSGGSGVLYASGDKFSSGATTYTLDDLDEKLALHGAG